MKVCSRQHLIFVELTATKVGMGHYWPTVNPFWSRPVLCLSLQWPGIYLIIYSDLVSIAYW